MQAALLFGGLILALTTALAVLVYVLLSRQAIVEQGQTLDTQAVSTAAVLSDGLYERMREVQLLAESVMLTQSGIDREAWLRVLDKMQQTRPQFAWLGVTDAQGMVLVAAQGMLEGKSVASRPWFQAALKGPFAGDVHPAKLLASLLPAQRYGEPWRFIDFAAPLLDNQGTLIGVLGVHGSWTWADDVIQSLSSKDSRYEGVKVFILNKKGEVLFQPRDLPDLSKEPLKLPRDLDKRPRVLAWPDGEGFITALAPVRPRNQLTDLGWTVVVRQPVDVAVRTALEIQRLVIIVGVLAGMLGIALAWLVAKRLSRPLSSMAMAAERIAMGERGVAMDGHGGVAELRQFSSAVTRMTQELLRHEQSLMAARDELEQKVRERTAELEASNNELARANAELDGLSRHDALTRLPNRRAADDRLVQELARHRRSETPLTIMLLDVDHFKAINDTHGHAVGDQVLMEVARRMSVICRGTDFVARFGGEEFLMLLPDTDALGAERLAGKVLEWVASLPVGPVPQVTASIGMVSVTPDRHLDPGPLVDAADQALYKAKRGGRNRAEAAEPPVLPPQT